MPDDQLVVSLIADSKKLDAKVAEADKKLAAFKRRASKTATVKITASIAKFDQQIAAARKQIAALRKDGKKGAALAIKVKLDKLKAGRKVATKALGDIRKETVKTQSSFSKLGTVVKGAVAAFLGFRALRVVFNFFVAAGKDAAKFELTMARISTLIVDDVVPSVKLFKEGILELTKVLPKDKNDLGEGLYQVLSAGVTDTAQAMDVLRVSAEAAVGGFTTTNTAVDAITTVINAFGLEAADARKVSDSLFTTVRLGKITFEQLASGIGKAATSANLTGVTIEELGASIGTMTKAGVNSDIALTALNRLFISLQNPSEQVSKNAQALGIDFSVAGIEANGFAAFIEDLSEKFEGNSDKIAQLGLDSRALKVLQILAGVSTAEFTSQIRDQNDALGESAAAFEKVGKTVDSQLKIAEEAFKNARIASGGFSNAIKLGVIGTLTQMIKILNVATDAVLRLSVGFANALGGPFGVGSGGNVGPLGVSKQVKTTGAKIVGEDLIDAEGNIIGVRKLEKEVIDAFGNIVKSTKAEDDALKELAKDLNKIETDFSNFGNNAKSAGEDSAEGSKEAKDAARELKQEIKEDKKAVEDFTKSIEDLNDKAEKNLKQTGDFFDKIGRKIDSAKDKQDALTDSLLDFVKQEEESFLQDFTEQRVELLAEELKLQEERRQLLAKGITNDSKSDLLKIDEQLKEIAIEKAGFDRVSKTFSEDELKIAKDLFEQEEARSKLTGIEQRFLKGQEAVAAKTEDVLDAQKEQQRIIDIQEQFINLRADNEKDLIAKINEFLDENDLAQLTRIETADLNKANMQAISLENERQAILDQQQDIFDVKGEFIIKGEKLFVESVDREVEKVNELKQAIQQAISAQLQLISLQGGTPNIGAGGNTIEVNQTITSDVDFESGTNSLLRQLNQ